MGSKGDTAEDFIRLAEEMTGEPQTREDILAEKAKNRNLADAEEIFTHAIRKQRLELPSVGAYVEYMPLRAKDRIEISSIVDPNPDVQRDLRNRRKVFLLLNRADDRYTMEAIENLGAAIIDAILLEYEMKEDSGFLLPILTRRRTGSTPTTKPKS